MTYYYSLKTKKEEHCLEQRIGGDFDYAVYDLKQNLLKPKELVKKTEVVKFIWDKQTELKTVFQKVSKDSPEQLEEKIASTIKEGIDKGFTVDWEDPVEIIQTEDVKVHKTKVHLSGKESSFIKKDNEYVLVARLDLDTNQTQLEVHSNPKESVLSIAKDHTQLIDTLFLAILSSLPDLVENYICAGMVKSTHVPYKEAVEGYRAQAGLRLKVYKSIVDVMARTIDIYKKQLEK